MILTKNELEIEALKKEIIACNALDSAKEGFSKVEQLEKLVNTDDNLEKQFILRSKALLGYLAGRYTKEEKLRMLIQAIGLTIPDFDLEIIGSHLYTVDEMKIINQIAGVYSDMGQNKKAADIYYQLLKYVQKHQQEAVISSGMLPMVLGNYARALDLCGYYKDAVDYAQRGIEACVRYGHYQMLYACLAIQAESYHFMKQDEKSAEGIPRGVLSLQSYRTKGVNACQSKRKRRIISDLSSDLSDFISARNCITKWWLAFVA